VLRTIAVVLALAGAAHAERPLVAAGDRQPRIHRDVAYAAPVGAALGSLASWHQIWDADTGVPLRMWGPSLPAFGTIASAATAEAAARAFVAEHLAVLAPGATASDFVVASNTVTGAIRTVGFEQTAHGLRVLGGSIAVTFERDHLVMVGSTAMPNIAVRMPTGMLAAATLDRSATAFLAGDNLSSHVARHGERVILPLIFTRGAKPTTDIAYRVADTVMVAADRGGDRWDVWLDAADGAPIARASRVVFSSGTVDFDTPDRYPAGGRSAKPAPNATHTVDGVVTTSDANGVVTWTAAGAAVLLPGLSGPMTNVMTVTGATATDSLSLPAGGSVIWSHPDDPQIDAQLDAFIYATQAKQFVGTRLDPALAFLSEITQVFVNDNSGTCNAYSASDNSIHFYAENATCENTGRIADVVYHEFGHSVHRSSVLPGVGSFDSSASEGFADTLAVSITGDPGMGRGFFYTSDPLRDLDPVGIEKKWPDDADGEPHDEGEIIGETLYDLRKGLEAQLGTAAGFTKFLAIFDGELQRSVDIPSTYADALLVDDDDGDLSNGVPDECAIDSAFAIHGLTTPEVTLGLAPPTVTNHTVSLVVPVPAHVNPACPLTVSSATLTWRLRDSTTTTDVPLVATGTTYAAELPTAPDGSTLLFHVVIAFSDGSSVAFPANRADPDYQIYTGPVTTLQCFDFESGDQGWIHAGNPSNKDEWEVGAPEGLNGDPAAAHGGMNVLGIDLDHDGLYSPATSQSATSPPIDLKGFTNVRLQYYRWLGTRDNKLDHATISANAIAVWTNYASPTMAAVSHIDREWRFHDLDLTPVLSAATNAPLVLKFDLVSGRGGTLGGWTIDDVCVVGIGAPGPVCGNGMLETGEQCDDGNVINGDGCSAACQTEPEPSIAPPEGCCSTGRGGSGAIVLSLATLCLVLRRRRRRT
jgi:cysteine-rich repeat protein